ncbi:Chitin binding domain, partial [Trinorchestia longiramus]
ISGAWGLCYPSCMDASNSSYVPEGTRVPNPSTCDEFFVCSDQGGDLGMGLSDEPLACPAGMYFDRSSASCQEIPDDGSIYCTPCNPCEVECTEPGAVAPNPYSCKDYYVCLQGGGYIEAECSDGNQFDFQSGECQLENVTRCFEACNKCEVYCVEEGRIPDPFDCNAYLYCEPGVGTAHFLCAEGYYYNSETQECDE